MIIHMKRGAVPQQEKAVLDRITSAGFKYEIIHGSTGIDVIGVLGDLSGVEESYFSELEGVDKVVRISKAYKLVSRQYSPAGRIIRVGGVEIGGPDPAVMAGPCSLESGEQVMTIAAYVAKLGIRIMRGGAYKPRTSPYSFQGLGLEGLKLLARACRKYRLRMITEATGLHRHLDRNGRPEKKSVLENVIEYADIIQVGTRNMKSYGFLQELAVQTKDSGKPILLKRGESSTLKDFLLAAEYIVANGNPNVMLCLRGIRAFEEPEFQRYTPDIGAVTVLKKESNLPVIFDPSHSIGNRAYVEGVSLAAVAAGADGLLIETHNDPANALCDGDQSVTEKELSRIKELVFKIKKAVNKSK
jgi:3-deoxy-7-phosphoheptulonate synthase